MCVCVCVLLSVCRLTGRKAPTYLLFVCVCMCVKHTFLLTQRDNMIFLQVRLEVGGMVAQDVIRTPHFR